jgi:hypothetical protein
MNYTGYTVLKIPKTGAAFAYAKEAREFATGATGAGGYLNSAAIASGWTDVRFVSAIREGSGPLPVSIGATYTDIHTGASTVIGGITPIGDLRSEDGPYVSVGSTAAYYTKKGQEYSAAFYTTYIGGTHSVPTKIGIGTTAGDITTNGYYEGSFTTRSIYEFDSVYNPDPDDPTKIITGSGVYKNGSDVSLQFSILNRNGELLTSASQIASDPFIDKQIISILDADSNVVFPSYRTNGNSTFTFSRSQNIDVFGSYNRNFGIRNEIVNKDGVTSTGEFYLYANTATLNQVTVQASGVTTRNENFTNHSPPDTGNIPSAADRADAIKYFNNQPISTSGSTGFIELTLGFNESPNFTNLGDLTIWNGTSGDFATNDSTLVGNYPLNSLQEGQQITLKADDGIQEVTPLFFKLVADSDVGFEPEIFTIGPYTLEPNVQGPDLNLYNEGDQSLVGDFTIEGGLEGDSSNGGNLHAVGEGRFDGNVGIGSLPQPNYKLYVEGIAGGSALGGRLQGPGDLPYLLSGDSPAENDTLQAVTTRGNTTTTDIGIGTTNPTFGGGGGLQISNSTRPNLRLSNTTNAFYNTDLAVINDDFHLINKSSSGDIKIKVADTIEAITIRYDGNVGIGTTASSSKQLYVNGTSQFTDQLTIPLTPSATTDAASKGYVDTQVGSYDTLQEVTDNGNTTTRDIYVEGLNISGSGNESSTIQLEGNTTTWEIESQATNQDDFRIYNTTLAKDAITIDSTNNHVGIGTSANSNDDVCVEGRVHFKRQVIGQAARSTKINTDGYSIQCSDKAVVGGLDCQIDSTGSAIMGGSGNHVSGDYDVIVAGASNNILGCDYAFIGGGSGIDVIDSEYSSSIGGYNNDISGSSYSVIGGGQNNSIEGSFSNYIGGGENNLITGANSFIGGGNTNKVLRDYSFVGAGEKNIASGDFSIIIGGEENQTFGTHSVIAGGEGNTVSGLRSFIGGGSYSEVNSDYSYAFGRKAKITSSQSGAAVFADGNNIDTLSSGAHTATLNFENGVYVQTTSGLYVNGNPVMTGVNPYDEDTLQTVTDRGNTTTTSIVSTGPYISGVTGLFSSNVGIGTTSPEALLDIGGGDGTPLGTQFRAVIKGTSARTLYLDSDSSGASMWWGSGNTPHFAIDSISGGGAGFWTYSGGWSQRLTINSSGNVGIGTVNPLTKLHINDGVNLNLKAGGSGSEFQIKATNDADTAYIPIITRASKYSILNGNVGIGATSPTATLQVGDNYTINASYGGSALYIKSTGSNISSYDPQITSTSDIGSLITISDNTTTGPTKAGLVLYNDDVTVGGFSPMLLFSKRESGSSPYKATMAGIYARSPLGTGDNDAWIDGELIFATAGAASHGIKQRMVIDKEGNVGIGTTNPSQKLHVVGNTITTGVSYTDIVQTYSGSSIDFRHQDASVVMRVDTPNARVGIGTTSPATKLHVVGRARFDDTQINAKGVFADYFSSGQSLTLNSGASASILFKIGNTTALTLDSSQNATFAGTITSANILPISDAAYTIGGGSSSLRWNYLYLNNTLSITDGNINAGTTFDFNQGANFLGDLTVSGGNITLGGTGRIQGVDTVTDATDAANKAYVDAQVGASDTLQEVTDNGNTTTNSVGIGASSSPSFTSGGGLQITNATQANLRLSDSSNASYNLDLAMSNDDFYLVNRSATGHLKFRVNNSTEAITVLQDGNVGIGTTNPSRKFEVHEGNVYLKVGAQSGYTDGYGPILTTNSNSIVAPERVYLAASQAYIRRENIGGQGLTLHGDTFSRFTYYNGSSTVEALRIDNSGNVGIGTTNPSTKLQVAGTSRFDGDLTVANSTLSITAAAPNLLFAVPSGGLDSRIFNDGSGNFIIGHGTNSNSPTERLRIDSAGNVGIGTVSPQAALHVAGAIPVAPTGSGVLMGLQSNYAIIHLNGSTGGIIDFSSSGVDRKGRILYDNTGNYMQIQTNGSNKVRIDSAGKVGIGTVSPATILDLDDGTVSDIRIRGNATTDVRFAGIAFYNTAGSDTVAAVNVDRDGANDAGALTFDTQPAGGGNTERLRISSTGAIKFNNYGAGTFTGTVTQKLGVDSSGNVIEMPIGAGPVDGSGTANYLARWIDSDTLGIGAAYDNGTNVGIGTNTPNSLLNVQGDSDPTILINAVTGNSTNSGKLAFAETDGGALQAWIKYDGSANRLELGTSDVPQALVIKRTDGNVGIGTTNPSQKFEVVGQAIIDGGVGVSSSGTLHLRQQGNTSSDGLAITSAYGTSHRIWKDVNGKLNIGPSNLPSSFVQDVNGNVGIGTTNPAKKLEVNGSFKLGTNAYIEYGGTYPYTITTANTAAVGNLVFSAGLGSTGYESKIELQGTNVAADAAITLSTASSAKVTILNNGNVGIGITNPSTKLHVSGIVQIAASGETAFYEGNGVRVFGTQNYRFRNTGGGVRAIIDVNSTGVSAGNLSLYNASNVITSYINNAGNSYFNGGNIGIGTTSPTHKLDVRGDILVKGGSTQHSVIRFRRSNLTYDFAYIGFENPAAANDEFLISSAGNGNPMKIQAGASKALNFYGNTTAYGGFNGSGNFGIGTTSPNYQLDVRDGIVFAGRAVSDDGGISYTNTAAVFSSRGVDHDASRTNVLRLMRDGTTGVQYAGLADFDLESWESSGVYSRTAMTLKLGHGNLPSDTADVMTWRSNGNVGIGTTSPSQKLQINGVEGLPATTGTSQNALLRLTPNAPTNGESLDFGMRVSGSDSIGWIQATNFGNLGTNYDIALNPNGGNVGIGTTNPATKLSVSGGDISAYTSNGTSRIFVSENGTTGFNGLVMQCNGGANNTDFYTTNTGNGMWISAIGGNSDIGLSANRDIYLKTDNGGSLKGGTTQVTVKQDGNVGIGTTSPQAKLQVSGGIQMADDIDTASASKVGTMRYRTGTEYVEVDGVELVPSVATIVNAGGGTITQISGNSYSSTSDGTSGSSIRPKFDFATTAGTTYKLLITPTGAITGTVNFDFYDGASYLFQNYDFTTDKDIYFTDNGTVFAAFDGVNAYSIAGFTISITEVTAEDASYADMCMQTAASTYEWVNIVRNSY